MACKSLIESLLGILNIRVVYFRRVDEFEVINLISISIIETLNTYLTFDADTKSFSINILNFIYFN